MIGDGLGPQDYLLPITRQLAVEPLGDLLAQREGGRRRDKQLRRLEHLQHAVLDDLGVGGEPAIAFPLYTSA